MEYEVLPFGRERQLTIQGGRLAARRHTVHGLIEADVTQARQLIRAHEQRTGEAISFTAFVAHCLGKAVGEHKEVHAYRNWRNQRILFDDVDLNTAIQIQMPGRTAVMPHWLRAANKRSLAELHAEIRATQTRPEQTREFAFKWLGYLPPLAWDIFFLFVFRNPGWLKKSFGTVGLTAVGMFGRGGGWAIPFGVHTLDVAVGGIALKPGIVDGRIEPREYLCLTLSFDHDLVDGGPAARFTQRFRELIESSDGLVELVREGGTQDERISV